MIIAVVAVGLHTLPTTAIIVMSIAHRYLQQKKRRTRVLLFCTPSGARLRYLQEAVVCSFSLHPPNRPGREATSGFSPEEDTKKARNFRFSLSVPPQVVPVTRCVPGVPDFILIV